MKKILVLVALTVSSVALGQSSLQDMCAKEWPGNFKMQKFCINEQGEAAVGIKEWLAKYGMTAESRSEPSNQAKVPAQIFDDCNDQWYPNMKMTLHCTKEQEEAAIKLGRIGGSAVDSVEFEDGISGDIQAMSIAMDFSDRHGFGGHVDEIDKAANKGNKAAIIYKKCDPGEGEGITHFRVLAKCLLAAEDKGI